MDKMVKLKGFILEKSKPHVGLLPCANMDYMESLQAVLSGTIYRFDLMITKVIANRYFASLNDSPHWHNHGLFTSECTVLQPVLILVVFCPVLSPVPDSPHPTPTP